MSHVLNVAKPTNCMNLNNHTTDEAQSNGGAEMQPPEKDFGHAHNQTKTNAGDKL